VLTENPISKEARSVDRSVFRVRNIAVRSEITPLWPPLNPACNSRSRPGTAAEPYEMPDAACAPEEARAWPKRQETEDKKSFQFSDLAHFLEKLS